MILEDLHSILIAQYLIPLSLCFFQYLDATTVLLTKLSGSPVRSSAHPLKEERRRRCQASVEEAVPFDI